MMRRRAVRAGEPAVPHRAGRRCAPSITTLSPARSSKSLTAPARASSVTAIMPIPQLKVRSISCSEISPICCNQPNTGGQGIAVRSISATLSVGQYARHVLDQPAAGDMGERLIPISWRGPPPAPASRRFASAAATPRQAICRERRALRRDRRGRSSDEPADQRIAVGMRPRGQDAENAIARLYVQFWQDFFALDRADRESGKVVVIAADTCPAFPRSRRR